MKNPIIDETHQHYKMYKSGRQWVFASIAALTMLTAAGFSPITPADYGEVVREQQRAAPLHDALRLGSSTRFALLAHKPADAAASR